MKTFFSLLVLAVFLVTGSCEFIFPDDQKKDTEEVPASRMLLNYFYENAEFKYVYSDGSKDIYGKGGQNGNFDSNYGTSVSKTENGVKVLIGTIDRVMPFGETVKAELKLVFNDDETRIKELIFEKSSEKSNNTTEWVLKAKDIVLIDDSAEKKVYSITGKDVCTRTTEHQHKLNTTSYEKTISDWDLCQPNDNSHITIEIFKSTT